MTDASPVPNYSVLMTALFALALMASVILKFWLATRQVRHVALHRDTVPAAFQDQISLEAHHKAADYTIAQGRLGLLELAFGTAVVLGWTLLGGLSWLNQTLLEWMAPGVLQQVALLAAFMVIGSVLDLPFTLYRTFVLEQRFGFNKTTPKLWLQDLLKSSLVGAIIGLPIAALVVWMMGATGAYWWVWTWGVWMGFNLLMLLVYPTWIAPLFNQFKPLDDAALKDRVSALMARCGFTSKGFYVMDGSKRSAHANAYFTGFGASKRVVFYDTLLAQLSPAEVDAVLAHELGHFKHKHIVKRMVSLFGLSLLGFALLGWVSQQVWFYTGLGVVPSMTGANDALALLLFMMVLPLLGSFVGPVFAQLSRKHEFEADAYAVAHTSGADLSSALLKLYKDNASTLTPDPVYVKFYYSHPPASERLGRMLTPAGT
ncbi:MAG: peptidase M48 [Curvibacter sp. RIFCSPHIGHO2_12_FULL_63_18]|uniref:M48 family metallopeptidase n=1 Tax=Rhodoferax sp. TaxID=50421 RepID=UPI0008B7F49E|nr:M48 family metallopeptidase [Rhodoferax sp.]OGO99827.1 MAG: peptidase M48 [Curvibacter sp. GWA2_63_95]OGP00490.1 MAG: peptidase M48 [Curvibacter sp. RIFCSPHIGHO2_12_FULL_63_18]HCX82487.1 peptidase M48 [Rhodoferax sp.]